MMAIGETLRRERLRRNLELDQISRELKISARMLEAIEDERFDRLPGGVFAKSFVRQYAHMLGLDEEELAAEVQRLIDPPPEPVVIPPKPKASKLPVISSIHVPKMEEWESVGDHRFQWGSWLPALALVVVVMLVCSGVYSWWQHSRRPVAAHEETAAAVETHPASVPPSSEPAAAPPAVQPQAAAPNASSAAQPQPAVRNAPSATQQQPPAPNAPSAAPAQNSADRPAPEGVAQPANAAAHTEPPAAAPGGTLPAKAAPTNLSPNLSEGSNSSPAAPTNPNAALHVELIAAEPVWVLAKADGKFSFSGTLEANQHRVIDANQNLTLRLGNAGGISILVNGKPIGPVGPKGQVREVQFTSGGFQIVAPPKPLVDPL
jgi:cytoskeleton protein RodZ